MSSRNEGSGSTEVPWLGSGSGGGRGGNDIGSRGGNVLENRRMEVGGNDPYEIGKGGSVEIPPPPLQPSSPPSPVAPSLDDEFLTPKEIITTTYGEEFSKYRVMCSVV